MTKEALEFIKNEAGKTITPETPAEIVRYQFWIADHKGDNTVKIPDWVFFLHSVRWKPNGPIRVKVKNGEIEEEILNLEPGLTPVEQTYCFGEPMPIKPSSTLEVIFPVRGNQVIFDGYVVRPAGIMIAKEKYPCQPN